MVFFKYVSMKSSPHINTCVLFCYYYVTYLFKIRTICFALTFFRKNRFELNNKIYAYFFAGFCFYLLANSRWRILRKNDAIFLVQFLKFETFF